MNNFVLLILYQFVISNSFVTGNVKPFTMVGGVPAGLIKEDLQKSISETNKEIFKWWKKQIILKRLRNI